MMTAIRVDLKLTVTVTDRYSMERQLTEAEDTARSAAMQERGRGILITRHGPGQFTVALSDAVPFGLTRECQNS
jgi:hypothetical protein